jgi:hypothetical protein
MVVLVCVAVLRNRVSEIIRAMAVAGRSWLGPTAALLVSVGVALVIGAGIYRVFVRPEWTFAQALHALWPFFLTGCIALMLGLLADRAEG